MKTIFVSGNFNIVHPGHLRLLRFARELGDELIVGVYSDQLGGDAIHVGEDLRVEGVRSIGFVDETFLIEESIENVIKRVRPDIVVKGKEHEDTHNPELDAVSEYGGRLIFSSGELVFSSLDLLRKSVISERSARLIFPSGYAKRHGITKETLSNYVLGFTGLRVCVIGDLILDEYVTCDPLGMSQEDPTIVVTPVDTQRYMGGAGIVAVHAAGLGGVVSFVSVVGDDEGAEYARDKLEGYEIDSHLIIDESRPTTLKQRFRADDKTLLRVSHLHQRPVGKGIQERLLSAVRELENKFDLFVFSDFNYGCLPQKLVEDLIREISIPTITVVADSQCSSQNGDVSRFRGMDLLTPTEWEARVSLRNQVDGLVVIAEALKKASTARNIILKLGAEGVLLHFQGDHEFSDTDRIPALNPLPQDVAGAGDCMLISSSMAVASGASFWEAALIGSLASGIQVGRIGNMQLRSETLVKELSDWM